MNLITILTILPFLNFFCLFAKKEEGEISQDFAYKISKIFAFAFFVILFGVMRDFDQNQVEILKFNAQISFFIGASKENISQLFLLSAIWLVLAFYIPSFLSFNQSEIGDEDAEFAIFLPLFIAFLNIIIISKNLPTLFLGYGFVAIIFTFILQKFLMIEESDEKSNIFIGLTLLEVVLFFIFTILVFSFSQDLSFAKNGVQISAGKKVTAAIFAIFFASTFLTSTISPVLLLRKNIDFVSLKNYLAFPLFLGFAKLVVFAKIVTKIIGIGLFSTFLNKYYILLIEIFFAAAIIFTLLAILFSHDFRKIFFYLFFNQINLAFLSLFAIFYSDEINSQEIISHFILFITLSFIILLNFTLYLKNSQNKEFDGIFYNLKITISILIFTFLNLSSLAPPLLLQNISLLKISLANGLFISFLAIILNSIGILLFIYKLVFPTFSRQGVKYYEDDINLAKKIDFSSMLSLTALLICVIILMMPIIKIFL